MIQTAPLAGLSSPPCRAKPALRPRQSRRGVLVVTARRHDARPVGATASGRATAKPAQYNFMETHRVVDNAIMHTSDSSSTTQRGAPIAAQNSRPTSSAQGQSGGAAASAPSHAHYNFVDTHTVQQKERCEPVPLNQCRALVLDCAYRPIDVVNWQRAITLDMFDKVDVLEYYSDKEVYSPNDVHQLPAVLKVRMYVQKDKNGSLVNLSKRNIFIRDKYTCQYCGCRSKLTVDHVVPVSKGGPWSWNNLVAACSPCNSAKGDKDLKHLPHMKLKRKPSMPGAADVGLIAAMSMREVFAPPPEWTNYLVSMDKGAALKSVVEDLIEQQEKRRNQGYSH